MALVIITGGMQSAFAAGTTAGTVIGNTATVDYQVTGANQPTVTSNTENVTVDNRIDLTVNNTAGDSVVPNSTDQAVAFTVTNTGNKTQGYSLSAANLAAGDDFDMTNLRIYIDDGDGIWEGTGVETAYTPGNNAFDLLEDATSAVVFVVADTPITATNGQTANVTLLATTLNAGTAVVTTALTSADANTAGEDNVFGDGTGTAAGDIDNDGEHSATGTFTVAVNPVTLTKSSAIISDPINLAVNPKAIPGATIRYTLVVTNPGAAASDATNVVVVDDIPANTTYTGGTITLNAAAQTDASDSPTDESDYNVTNATAITVGVGTLAPGASATITFDVTID